MADGDRTSNGLGREQHTGMKCLGKAAQEVQTSTTLESLSGLEKNLNPKIKSTPNVAQNLTLSKSKQALQDSKYGHDSLDPNKQSSTSWPIRSFRDGFGIFPSSNEEHIVALGPSSSSKKRLIQTFQDTETDSQNDGPDPAQSNLKSIAQTVSIAIEPNVDSIVVVHGEAPIEPNGGPLVLHDIGCVEPLVGPILILHGAAPIQPNVSLIVAPPDEVLAQPNIASNIASPALVFVASNVVPRRIALGQPNVAPHAQRNGAPTAPTQPNAALIVAPPGVALGQQNRVLVVAPPEVVLDVIHGLNCSQLKLLRFCEIGLEGHFWPNFPRS